MFLDPGLPHLYDHLAGRLGVALADAFTARGLVTQADSGSEVTDGGRAFLPTVGIDLASDGSTRRAECSFSSM